MKHACTLITPEQHAALKAYADERGTTIRCILTTFIARVTGIDGGLNIHQGRTYQQQKGQEPCQKIENNQ